MLRNKVLSRTLYCLPNYRGARMISKCFIIFISVRTRFGRLSIYSSIVVVLAQTISMVTTKCPERWIC